MIPDGSRSILRVPRLDAVLGERVDRLDMHPTGPLWDTGETPVAGEAAALKAEALAGCEVCYEVSRRRGWSWRGGHSGIA